MKKYMIFGLSLIWCVVLIGHVEANHKQVLNAGNLTTGIIPNARQDPSSVTLQGNSFNGANQLLQLDGSGNIPNANISPANISALPNVVVSSNIKDGSLTGSDFGSGQMVSTHIASINGQLVPLSNQLAYQDEGVFQNNIGTINCVGGGIECTNSGQVMKINISGGVTISSVPTKPWTGIVVGTLAANPWEVDIASNNQDGIIEAVRRLGAQGLTTSATAFGNIYLRDGIYQWKATDGSTIPAGVSFLATGSSAVIKMAISGLLTYPVFTIYGTVDGGANKALTIDCTGMTLISTVLQVRDGGTLRNIKTVKSHSMTGGLIEQPFLSMNDAVNPRVEGCIFSDIRQVGGVNMYGDDTALQIFRSTNAYFGHNTVNVDNQAAGNSTGLSVWKTSNTVIEYNDFNGIGANFTSIPGGNMNLRYSYNRHKISFGTTDRAVTTIGSGNGNTFTTTGTVVIEDNIYITTISVGAPIIGDSGAGPFANVDGLVINNNRAYCYVSQPAWNFIGLTSNYTRCIIENNKSQGCGVQKTDNGTSNTFTNNYKDGSASN